MRKLKIMSALLVAGMVICFSGCGPKAPANTPDAVVIDVLKTLQAGKADKEYLLKYCTESTAKMFLNFGEMAKKNLAGETFTVVDTKVFGGQARVKVKVGGEEEEYNLWNEEGQWKVHFKKD